MLKGNRGLLQAAFPALFFLLLLATLPLFSGFVEFTGDDYYYIVNNPLVTTSGFKSLAAIWREPMKIEYFPVTITTFALEYRLWGGEVKFYHLTNLLIFIAIGFAVRSLTFRLIRPLAGIGPDSDSLVLPVMAAALLFLAHPLNVESVASIANRKELLYVLFGILSLRCHLAENPRALTIIGTILFMALAQLSKGSAIILPALFVVCELAHPGSGKRSFRRLLLPALYSLVAVAIFALQFKVALRAGVVTSSEGLGLVQHAGGIVRSVNVMLGKLIYPLHLSYDYDLLWPKGFPPLPEFLLPVSILALLGWLVLHRKWQLFYLCCLALLTLVPYANILRLRHNVSGQMVFYDHYLLFATMLAVPVLAIVLLHTQGKWRAMSVAGIISLSVAMTCYNYQLYGFWKTREALYQRIIAVTPQLPKGYLFLGKTYNEQGRYAEATAVLTKLIATKNWFPTYLEGYRELGNAYAFSGRLAEAVDVYRQHLAYQPRDRITLQNLSAALVEQQKYREALEVINAWQSHYPDDQDALHNRQLCEQKLRQL